jgi:flavin reductase (DIM6/NTAB) family NADH-FMN oxidoreductase RutF
MRIPLFGSLQERLRPTPQWLAISLPAAEQSVEVKLLAGQDSFDVTLDSAVAAMRPFTLRLGCSDELAATLQRVPEPELHFTDREFGRLMGILRLRYLRDWSTAGARMALCEIVAGTHYCAPWPRRTWDSWQYRRTARRTPPERLVMLPEAVEQMLIFYLRPRPVFFVSVDDGQHSNVFPMDLVGPLQPEGFTLALRNTSPSVETMKRTRQIALGDVPGSACQIAYQLGAHHKRLQVDWDALPFQALRSPRFSLRLPDIALRVREVELLDFQTVGSHTLFVGRICSEEPLHAGPQLCHTCGVQQRLRSQLGRLFQEARQKPLGVTARSEGAKEP